MTSNMKDREPRRLPLKAATAVASIVLMVGGGEVFREGIIDESNARDQVELTHPHPNTQLVTQAKAAVAFTETQNTPSFTEVNKAAQDVLDRDRVFDIALDENKVYQSGKKKLNFGAGGFIAGYLLLMGNILHS